MNARALTLFFWLTLIGTATVASGDHETHIKIKVDEGADTLEWYGDDSDLDLDCLDAALADARVDKDATN